MESLCSMLMMVSSATPPTKTSAGVPSARCCAVCRVTVTASVGVAAYPDHATNTEQLERLADSALYLAKRSGRNRVEIATTTDPITPPSDNPPQPALALTAVNPTMQ